MGQSISQTALGQAITIELDELVELVQEINKKCLDASSDPSSEYLCFAITNGSINNFLWKATVRICCFKRKHGEQEPDMKIYRMFTLRQFLRLYKAVKPLLETVNLNPNSMFENPDVMNASVFQDSCTEEGKCVICLEREPDTILDCAHAYCSKCLAECQKYHQKCPLCRVGSTYEEDQWVVPDIPDSKTVKGYVEQLLKPS